MDNLEASGMAESGISPQRLGENLTAKEIQTEGQKIRVFFADHSPDRVETSTDDMF